LGLQVLYSYPPESPVSADLPSFCFPHGVQPTLLERTPSMSSLNDLLYSQNYLNSDASSFIFLLKVRLGIIPQMSLLRAVSILLSMAAKSCECSTDKTHRTAHSQADKYMSLC